MSTRLVRAPSCRLWHQESDFILLTGGHCSSLPWFSGRRSTVMPMMATTSQHSVSAVTPGKGEKSFLSSSRQSSKADRTHELAKPGSGHGMTSRWGQGVALPKAHGLRVGTGDFPQEREFCYQKGCWAAKATFVFFFISVSYGEIVDMVRVLEN